MFHLPRRLLRCAHPKKKKESAPVMERADGSGARSAAKKAKVVRFQRTKFTPADLALLRATFEEDLPASAFPDDETLSSICVICGKKRRPIRVWFQNARQRAGLQGTRKSSHAEDARADSKAVLRDNAVPIAPAWPVAQVCARPM